MNKIVLVTGLIILSIFWSCRKAQDIALVLPEYQGKLMVECYIEPGKGYRLLLTESVSYLEPEIARPIFNALVTIKYKDKIDTLRFNSQIMALSDSVKVYNYINSNVVVPQDFENTFELYIKDQQGRELTAITKIPKPLIIDSAKVVLESEQRAALVYVKDNRETLKYYRFMVFKNNNTGIEVHSFITDNQQIKLSPFLFGNSNQIIFKSKSDFFINEKNEILKSIAVRSFEINKEYYDFLTSVRNANSANGNPFAQPASIISNVKGGVGIFTGFAPNIKILSVP